MKEHSFTLIGIVPADLVHMLGENHIVAFLTGNVSSAWNLIGSKI